jgi:hypothetical protein
VTRTQEVAAAEAEVEPDESEALDDGDDDLEEGSAAVAAEGDEGRAGA